MTAVSTFAVDDDAVVLADSPTLIEARKSLDAMLTIVVNEGGSDLHVTAGSPPSMRLHGSLYHLRGYDPLTPADTALLMRSVLKEHQWETFEETHEFDLAYSVQGLSRFRVNVYQQRNSYGGAFRVIPHEIKPLDALGVPPAVARFAALPRGLVLVTGPTGSGKTTTLASLLDLANRTRSAHIVTIEDPIEFLHEHKKCLVNQREVGEDTKSFSMALKHALRQDPDIILVGELRDLETTSTALTAAETGHLVLATLHTQSAAQTIDRIIDIFPPHQQQEIRAQLSTSLQGVVTQALAPRADGKGRTIITEIMFATPAIRNLIREGKNHQIPSFMQSGASSGMLSFDQHLAQRVMQQTITYEQGIELCHSVEEYTRLVGEVLTMPATKQFDYKILDANGKQTKGRLAAPNEVAAVAALKQQGSVTLSIQEAGVGLGTELKIPFFGGKVKLRDLAIFMRQFATMTNSGLSLLRSLAILEEQTSSPPLAKAIRETRIDIERGLTLSGSMAKHPKVFPTLTVAMVRAGETGGFLDDALTRIATNLEKDATLRGKVKSALTYPVLVLCFSLLMIAGVLIFIVPVFEKMFKSLGSTLPLPTQIIVNISHALLWLGPLLLIVGFVVAVTIKWLLRTRPGFRLGWDTLKLKLPVFGNLFAKIAISRFSRNLGTLLSVGVPVMQALDVVGATTGNALISAAMVDVQEAVRQGEAMSGPLSQHKVFPQMVTQMVEVGEESGQISQMLDKIADFYDREVDQAADALTAAIEPIMVVLMGAIVGGMVICLYLPMFSIYSHISGATS